MAYTKTTWQDNVTDIDENNLNKIEQGIYDNSLVVDLIKDKLNPTDTETYTTEEITEGQITNVIGVNDILIKGQTSQNGTPTPSAPVDVNVVSGSNVVNTSNKNVFNEIYQQGTLQLGSGGAETSSNTRIRSGYILVNPSTTYTIINSNSNIYQFGAGLYKKDKSYDSEHKINNAQWANFPYTITTQQDTKYIRLIFRKSGDANITPNGDYKIMLEQGSTATTYEPHQGKELPLDLPVENLFDKNNYVAGECYSNNQITANTPWGIYYLPCNSGETYIISGLKTYSNTQIVQCNSNKQFILNLVTRSTENTEYIVTATQNGYIGISFVWSTSASKGSEIDTINIKKAGTDPIELCKIGNYQDYFYKNGSKWYLHKEIGKVVFNGSESWSGLTDLGSCIRVNAYFRCKYQAQQLSDYFKYNTSYALDEEHFYNYDNNFYVFLLKTKATTIEEFKTWVSNHNITIYYVLETSTDTEITDTTLISQLEAIYNAPLYEQTNITQTNNDLPMILDITAYKDNIEGIKAWIRK